MFVRVPTKYCIRFLLLACCFNAWPDLFAQTFNSRIIAGQVFDSSGIKALSNVKVELRVKDPVTAMTDAEGYFQLEIPNFDQYNKNKEKEWEFVVEKDQQIMIFLRHLDPLLNNGSYYKFDFSPYRPTNHKASQDSVAVEMAYLDSGRVETALRFEPIQKICILTPFKNLTGNKRYDPFSTVLPEAILVLLKSPTFTSYWNKVYALSDAKSENCYETLSGAFFLTADGKLDFYVERDHPSGYGLSNESESFHQVVDTKNLAASLIDYLEKASLGEPVVNRSDNQQHFDMSIYPGLPLIYGQIDPFDRVRRINATLGFSLWAFNHESEPEATSWDATLRVRTHIPLFTKDGMNWSKIQLGLNRPPFPSLTMGYEYYSRTADKDSSRFVKRTPFFVGVASPEPPFSIWMTFGGNSPLGMWLGIEELSLLWAPTNEYEINGATFHSSSFESYVSLALSIGVPGLSASIKYIPTLYYYPNNFRGESHWENTSSIVFSITMTPMFIGFGSRFW